MIKIDSKFIGSRYKPFIIAEMSGNHNQSIDKALKIIEVAAQCGAHAIKLQTYTADSLTINHRGGLFDIQDKDSLWSGRSLYELYQEAHTPYEWHEALFKCAKDNGILCFSTPFDEEAVDLLEGLNSPCYKIASFENNYPHLLQRVAKTKKPVIVSTGLSTLEDIKYAVAVLRESHCEDLVLLKCTSSYPATPENTNILTIPDMKNLFQCEVGLSDHTMGIGVPCAAVAMGATVIEKHFCLSRAEGGVDSQFSLEPDELKSLVLETERAWQAIGDVSYGIQEAEKKSLRFKRSVYVVSDIKKGDVFTRENVRIIRPGDGISPRYFESILGRKVSRDLNRGEPVSFDMLVDNDLK